MTVEIQSPNAEQNEVMKNYAQKVEELVKLICEYENSFAYTNAIARAYESVHWFHSLIMNGGKKKELPKEGEIITKEGEMVKN